MVKFHLTLISIFSINSLVSTQKLTLVNDIYSGESDGILRDFEDEISELDSQIYFVGYDQLGFNPNIFVTDGTTSGTKKVSGENDLSSIDFFTLSRSGVFMESFSGGRTLNYYDLINDEARTLMSASGPFVQFIERSANGAYIFMGEQLFSDSDQIWYSEGTDSSTIFLADLTANDIAVSSYNDSLFIVSDISTSDDFVPIISNTRPEGTMPLVDYFDSEGLTFGQIESAFIIDNLIFITLTNNDSHIYNIDSEELYNVGIDGKIKNVLSLNGDYYILARRSLSFWSTSEENFRTITDDIDFFSPVHIYKNKLYYLSGGGFFSDRRLKSIDGANPQVNSFLNYEFGTNDLKVTMHGYEDYLYFTSTHDRQMDLLRANVNDPELEIVDTLITNTGG